MYNSSDSEGGSLIYSSRNTKSGRKSQTFLLSLYLASGAITPSVASVSSTIIDLGTLGGTFATATDINDKGEVVGDSFLAGNSASHAFIYRNGQLIDIGTLGGSYSNAIAINNQSQVVGGSFTTGDALTKGFVWSNGQIVTTGAIYGNSNARGINNLGDVVGNSGSPSGGGTAFLFQNNQISDLGKFGSTSASAEDINDWGVLAGDREVSSSVYHGFISYNGTTTDLGTLGGTHSYVAGLNNQNQVVGHSYTQNDSARHAFLYKNGVMHDLGTLGGTNSFGYDINDLGQVVGDAHNINGNVRAFLYSGGQMIDLNTVLPANSGWVLNSAKGINNRWQICGYGTYKGQGRPFRLTIHQPPTAVTDSATVDEDSSVNINVLSNDSDPNGDTLTVTSASTADHGMVTPIGAAGAYTGVTYTPNANYNGPDKFTYTISDGNGGTATATVTVHVSSVNDKPVAHAGSDQSIVASAALNSVTLDGTGSTDIDGDSLSYQWNKGATLLATGASPSIQLPAGTHTITLTVTDAGNLTSQDSVVVTVSLPASNVNTKVTGSGNFLNSNNQKVEFNFTGSVDKGGKVGGSLSYNDKSGKINIKSQKVTNVTKSGTSGRIYGTASFNGKGTYNFVLEAKDVAAKGKPGDSFILTLSDGSSYGGAVKSGDISVK